MDDIGKIFFQILIYSCIALFTGISQAAGIGGGPIINILLMLGLGYQAKASMAITYIFLIGGSAASICSNYGVRNKDATKNLIDTNLVMLTLPMTVSGSIFGALFNHFISELVIAIAFTLLLSYLAYSTYLKYVQSKRSRSSKQALVSSANISMEMQVLNSSKQKSKLEELLKEQLKPFPKQKLILFLQIIGYTIVLLLFKGGNSFDSVIGLSRCGFGTWVCVFIHLGVSYFVAKYIAQKQQKIDQEKQSMGYIFKNDNERMSKDFSRKTIILGFSGGFVGGMLGIGGAIILIPAWLEMGIDKNVASSSSAPLIISSAFISMIMAMLCHFYNSYTAIIFYFIFSFLSSYYVKLGIVYIKRRYKMEGILFLLLIIVMGMSLVFLVPYSVRKMLDNPEQFFMFGHMC